MTAEERTSYNEKLGECVFLTILDIGEDADGVYENDILCEKHHIWLNSSEVCLHCKSEWTQEQINDFEIDNFHNKCKEMCEK